MKKIVLSLCCVILVTSMGHAQTADPQSKPATAKDAQAKPAKKAAAKKKPDTDKKKVAEKQQKEVAANPQQQQRHALTNEDVQRMQQEQLQKDPKHPLTAAEMDARRAAMNAQTNTGADGKNKPTVKKPLREEGTPDRPLTAAEVQALNAKGKKIPPPPPPPGPNTLVSNEEIKKAATDPEAAHFEFVGGESYSYGEIIENDEPAPHDFEFINTGKKPLIIQEAHGSCGCTVPTFSKEPVLPGKKGIITVKYSSRGRVGPINKEVTITANTNPNPVVLHISGTVKANPDFTNPPPPPPMPQPASQQGGK